MSTQTMRGPTVRGYHRRKSLDLDLNNVPPSENRDQGETSHSGFQEAQVNQLQEVQVNQQQSVQPAMIDIEAIDDDVIESSARAFAEAKNKSRRNGGRNIVDVDAVVVDERGRVSNNNRNKRRREGLNQRVVNCDLLYINLEVSNSSTKEKPAAPPKEPKFNCPICMGPLVEETSTRCGHIFCKACIKAAINVQSKCPTCRKRVTAKELIRVFLPVTSLD